MRAAFAMNPTLLDEFFPVELRERLAARVTLSDVVLDTFACVPSVSPGSSFSPLPASSADPLADLEILLTAWGCPRIDAAILARAPRLRAVIHAAGSVKGHLAPEIFTRGIVVSSAAAANAIPVADYTLAMLVLAAKSVPRRVRIYSTGTWPAGPWPGIPLPGEGGGLSDVVVGVIGASRVGRIVIDRLRSYDTEILLYDPYLDVSTARALGCAVVSLEDLCRRSDLVTVHAPALPETRHLLDARRLALLPDGATVLNTARGSLIDTAALTAECVSGRINAILDVTDPEPLPADHPLLSAPGVWITPHISGARGRELRRLGEYAVAEVERLVAGLPLHGLVEQSDLSRIA